MGITLTPAAAAFFKGFSINSQAQLLHGGRPLHLDFMGPKSQYRFKDMVSAAADVPNGIARYEGYAVRLSQDSDRLFVGVRSNDGRGVKHLVRKEDGIVEKTVVSLSVPNASRLSDLKHFIAGDDYLSMGQSLFLNTQIPGELRDAGDGRYTTKGDGSSEWVYIAVNPNEGLNFNLIYPGLPGRIPSALVSAFDYASATHDFPLGPMTYEDVVSIRRGILGLVRDYSEAVA